MSNLTYLSGYSLFTLEDEADLSFVPKMHRRRLSDNIKSSLFVAHGLVGNAKLPMVFASRYGEWRQTQLLLKTYCEEGFISPMGFGLSVHNAAAGLFSLINANKEPYSFVSAGPLTFSMGLLNALMNLELAEQVLYVYSDETAPEIYADIAPTYTPCALALLISRSEGVAVNWAYTEDVAADDPIAFANFMARQKSSIHTGKLKLDLAR